MSQGWSGPAMDPIGQQPTQPFRPGAPYTPGGLDPGPFGTAYQPLSPEWVSAGPAVRPGSVTAGCVLAIVYGGLGAAAGGLMMAGGALFGAWSSQLAAEGGEGAAWGSLVGAIGAGVALVGLLMLAWSVLQIVFAALALRPRNGARIVVVVLTGAAAVFQLLSTVRSMVDGELAGATWGLLFTVAMALPVVLLLSGEANRYYAGPR